MTATHERERCEPRRDAARNDDLARPETAGRKEREQQAFQVHSRASSELPVRFRSLRPISAPPEPDVPSLAKTAHDGTLRPRHAAVPHCTVTGPRRTSPMATVTSPPCLIASADIRVQDEIDETVAELGALQRVVRRCERRVVSRNQDRRVGRVAE